MESCSQASVQLSLTCSTILPGDEAKLRATLTHGYNSK